MTDFNKGLHPTQVQMFWDKCPMQFEFRYIKGLRTPPAAAMYQGTAYHGGLEENAKHKIATGEDLPVGAVEEITAERWDNLCTREAPVLDGGQEGGALKDQVVALASTYRTEVAPSVLPKQAELALFVEVEDAFPLACRLDLIDIDDIDIEHKTSKSAWSDDSAQGNLQMTAYEYARRRSLGHETPGGQFHIAVKTKQPKIQRIEVVKTQEQLDGFERVHRFVSGAIQAGDFPPRTDGWWCSAKWCGYWERCPLGARQAKQFQIEQEVLA